MNAPDDARPTPAWKPLTDRQRRVLGVLLEKAATTPAAYPMTVNAIVTGCNQKNNREPVTNYDDVDVEQALSELQDLKVVSEIDWMGRVPKYKHHAFEWLGVDRTEMAVMTELLLRGAQALGELRARAARMAPIEDLAALKRVVAALLERGLMQELTPAGRGQVVSHALYSPPEREALLRQFAGGGGGAFAPAAAAAAHRVDAPGPAPSAPPAAAGGLLAELAGLRAEVAELRARLDALEAGRREGGPDFQ